MINPEDLDGDLDPTNRVYIADMGHDAKAGTHTILFNRGDPVAADPAFIVHKSSEVRYSPPEDGESQGWSAHLVIRSGGQESDGGYRACFESMQGLSSSLVDRFIRRILTRYADGRPKYVYTAKVKRKGKVVDETRTYRPNLKIRRIPSASVKEDISAGVLSSIILTERQSEYSGPDALNIVRSTDHQLVLRTHPVGSDKLERFISDLTGWAQKDYDEIQFKIDKLPGGGSSSPRAVLDQTDALDTLYVRAERLAQFEGMLERCYPTICNELEEKMKNIVTSNGYW